MQPNDPTDRFTKWREYVEGVARRAAPALRRYGWDGDDAAQTACVKLLAVVRTERFGRLADACLRRSLPHIIRKTLFRLAAAKRNLVLTVEDQVLRLAASRGDDSAAEAVTDALADAPPRVRAYLEAALCGRAPDDWRARKAAARYLEGRLECPA